MVTKLVWSWKLLHILSTKVHYQSVSSVYLSILTWYDSLIIPWIAYFTFISAPLQVTDKSWHVFILSLKGFSRFVWITFYFSSKAAAEALATARLTLYPPSTRWYWWLSYLHLLIFSVNEFKYLKKKGDEVCLNYVWFDLFNTMRSIISGEKKM